jgi:hypothetical protein
MSSTLQSTSQYTFGPANGGGDIIHFQNAQNKVVSWIDSSGIGQGALASSGSVNKTNVINVTDYGAKFDGKIFYGNTSTIAVTNGSATVTCSNCNFTSADVGKQFTATCGGYGGVSNAYLGTVAIPKSSTTILAVNSPTSITISQNATQSCTTTAEIAYATNDDAALNAAEAAWQALPICGTIVLPAGMTAVLQGHFNNPGTSCVNQQTSVSYDAAVFGQGDASTQIGIFPGFDSTTCTGGGASHVCFFGYGQAIVQNLSLNGFGWGNTSFASPVILMGPGLGSQIQQVSCSCVGGSDTNLTGFGFLGNAVRVWGLTMDGCGATGGVVNGSLAVSYFSFFGDNLGACLSILAGSDFTDFGGAYGLTGGTILIRQAGIFRSFSGQVFTCGSAANINAIYMSNSTNAATYLTNASFKCAGTTSNGIFMNDSTQKVYLTQSFIGGTANAILRSAGTVYVDGQSIFSNGGSITSLAPTCTFTSGGGTSPSCALQAGSTNEKGAIIATTGTGSPGATGAITLTFAGTYTGPSGAAPNCVYTLDDSGTTWGDGALARVSTQSTTAPVVAFTNSVNNVQTALTASSPYRISYSCVAR